METPKVVTIPNHWTSPKYSLGQRTKQGVIVGIQYYPPNNLLTGLCNESWRYAVLNKNDFSEVSHLEEEKIHPLTPLELRTELQAEIEAYQCKILTHLPHPNCHKRKLLRKKRQERIKTYI